MAQNAENSKQPDPSDEAPWWHENASEFVEDSSEPDTDKDESSELFNTATQEAIQLASTLSTWAEKTGFGPILRSVAQQAVDTAQDAAGSLIASGALTKSQTNEPEARDLADLEVYEADLDIELKSVDLDSDEYSHLDDDPAAAGVVQFNSTGGLQAGDDHNHRSTDSSEVRVACDYCPVCRVIESLDDLNPETAAAIAEVMAVVTDGVASAVMELVSKSPDSDE